MPDVPSQAEGDPCIRGEPEKFKIPVCQIFMEESEMPNIKSAKKRVKVIEKKTLQNKMFKSAMKTEIKKYNAAIASGDVALAQAAYKAATKKIDVAASKGIIHKNAAAHKKSQFTKALAGMQK